MEAFHLKAAPEKHKKTRGTNSHSQGSLLATVCVCVRVCVYKIKSFTVKINLEK